MANQIRTRSPETMRSDTLRTVALDGYRLRTWDTNRTDRDGKSIVGYELTAPDGTVLFRGEDFHCSPLHAIDSDTATRAVLSFLCLRPGDTSRDFFDSYTPEQMAFARGDAEQLSLYAIDDPELAAAYPLVDVDDAANRGSC